MLVVEIVFVNIIQRIKKSALEKKGEVPCDEKQTT